MAHEYSAVECSRCGKYTIQILSHSIPIELLDKKLLICPECAKRLDVKADAVDVLREILDLLRAEMLSRGVFVKRSSMIPRFIQCIRIVPLYAKEAFVNCTDPDLKMGAIYEVIDEKVDVMNDDPWINIRLPDGREVRYPEW
jgi:hypothetical protein